MADPLDAILQTIAALAFVACLVLITGYLMDPNDYPRDRPAPMLAVYATCPTEAP